MAKAIERGITLQVADCGWCGRFKAMASDCEVLIDSDDRDAAQKITEIVAAEAWRIEQKFSRYRDDSVLHRINTAEGQSIEVDIETAKLLDFGAAAFALSEGKFDVSSGVMRTLWRFDGSDRVPELIESQALLSLMGWQKVQWQPPMLRLPLGMQIDFGGIGKEYAVDSATALAREYLDAAILVNFGGDICATQPPRGKTHWLVGVDQLAENQAVMVQLKAGGLATSGDSKQFLLKDGVRYPHVLDPTTAWPVLQAPNSVTVAADSCVEAGLLATLAMLEGADAEDFLQAQDVTHWVQRYSEGR
ncbi:MAG: FAD:protein FMN transferase [Pseudomonadales bacterium]